MIISSQATIALINAFKEPVIGTFKDIKEDVKYFFDNGLPTYIESQRNKFLNTKTFLYRNEKVNFYNVYFPITIYDKKKNVKGDINIISLFNESNYISVIGTAGSGKSMLIKYIFLNCIDSVFKIPIFIELRMLNVFNGNITDYIYKIIFNNNLASNNKIIEKLLATGKFLFLLDGFDELYSDNKQKIIDDIESFIDRYFKNFFLLTSRPGVDLEGLSRFNNYHVRNLNKKEIEIFIEKQFTFQDDIEQGTKIITTLKKPENNNYTQYLSNPLLLSMFIFTFNYYPDLPKSKGKFYWNVFDTLSTRHDSFTKKGGWQHQRRSGLPNETIEQLLKWFSYISLFKGIYTFDSFYLNQTLTQIKSELKVEFNVSYLIEDLVTSISILVEDGLEYKFPHKSLQEYFTVLLIKGLNSSDKKLVYSSKFAQAEKFSFTGDYNFWSLCLELDKLYFYNYYVIPTIEEFVLRASKIDDFSLIKYILNSLGVKLQFTIINGIYIGQGFSGRVPIPAINLIYFMEDSKHKIENLFTKALSLENYDSVTVVEFLQPLLDSGRFEIVSQVVLQNHSNLQTSFIISYNDMLSTDFLEFIHKIGMALKIRIAVDAISQYLESIKNNVKEEEKKGHSLLGI